MAILFDPHFQAVAANGRPESGATLAFYRAGTSSLMTVYQNSDATTPHANPVVADASGTLPPIFISEVSAYKIVLKDGNGVVLQTIDQIPPSSVDLESLAQAVSDAEAAADRAEEAASSFVEVGTNFKTVSVLLADETMGYAGSGDAIIVGAGDIVTAQGFRYAVAASAASDQHLETAGGVKLYALPTAEGRDAFNAWAAPLASDNTQSINDALNSGSGEITIPKGLWPVLGMVEVGIGKTINLNAGAHLQRPLSSDQETPVIWMRGSDSSLRGAGQTTSVVSSQKKCPRGVVLVGHWDMTQSHSNVTYCTLSGLQAYGPLSGGQTSGDVDVALKLTNPQHGGLASYFHNITDMRLAQANVGVHFQGWANGNIVSGIHGFRLGNVTHGGEENCMILIDGALDNVISSFFFHQSPNSDAVVVRDLDNTANGGALHIAQANIVKGSAEQGGASALGLNAIAGYTSIYDIVDNVQGGNFLHDRFYTSNTARFGNLAAQAPLHHGSLATYAGVGTRTIKVNLRTSLANNWRSGVVKILFAGVIPDGSGNEYAEYIIPISGPVSLGIGTPVKISGANLTITQTASSANSVTFTVAGGSASQNVSIMASGVASNRLSFA